MCKHHDKWNLAFSRLVGLTYHYQKRRGYEHSNLSCVMSACLLCGNPIHSSDCEENLGGLFARQDDLGEGDIGGYIHGKCP